MIYTMKECDFILSQIMDDELNHWERNFVASMRELRKQQRAMATKQVEKLSRIWDGEY